MAEKKGLTSLSDARALAQIAFNPLIIGYAMMTSSLRDIRTLPAFAWIAAASIALALPSATRAQTAVPPAPRLQLDVPFVPTPEDVVARMLEMGEVGEEDFVIDLGSGDGRIAIAAVKARGAQGALGVDIDPQRIREAKENATAAGVSDKVQFEQKNLFEMDLGKATVVTMYLLETVNAKLRPRLLELEPGTRIVSHAFTLGDWEPDQVANVNGRTVYQWTVPARVEGRWTLTDGKERVTLDLKQSFQKVEASTAAKGTEVKEVKLSGDVIELTLAGAKGERTYSGTVNGNSITPSASGDGWKAARS